MSNASKRDSSVARQLQAPTSQFDLEKAESAIGSDDDEQRVVRAREARRRFLLETDVVPAQAPLYAAWLAVWASQGGKIIRHAGMLMKNLPQPRAAGDYYDPFTYWVPRRAFGQIPSGYGTSSMNLLVISSITSGDFRPCTDDKRQGWEYAHSRVLRLDVQDHGSGVGMHASTNQPNNVESFLDVEQIISEQPDIQQVGVSVLRLTNARGQLLESHG
jgi:hypothetical protein